MLKLQSKDLYAILQSGNLNKDQLHWVYNALDSAVTLMVHGRLSEAIARSPHAATSYAFVRSMQGPALDMMLRGIAVQPIVRLQETQRYEAIRARAQGVLNRLADAIWGPEHYTERTKTRETYIPLGKRGQPLSPRSRVVVTETPTTRPRGLNANSNPQLLAFFNIALGLPVEHELRKTPHGTERTPSANDKALKKWAGIRTRGPGINVRDHTSIPVHYAAPFVSLIQTIRDADKMLSVLRSPLDQDGRMRCSYNVVGTESGRWSSSSSAFGRGTNLQNITPTMRRMFCADDGHVLVSTDLEQAESRLVAGLVWQATGDRAYWEACLSGDLHTTVCRMTWPELEWTSDAQHNRKLADQVCPDIPTYSYRDVAKRLGHGSNYRGSPFGIAQAVGIPGPLVVDFQRRYFAAYPAISSWHEWTKGQLLQHQHLDTPLDRRRWFFARPTEDSTLREAIAFVPQSTIAELLNLIMRRVWKRTLNWQNHFPHNPHAGIDPTKPSALPIQLLLQNHDAFLFQVPLNNVPLSHVIDQVNAEFQRATIPLVRGDQHEALTIPGEFVTGFNWAYADTSPNQASWKFKDGNPDGLIKWRGSDERLRRQRATAGPGDWLGGRLS